MCALPICGTPRKKRVARRDRGRGRAFGHDHLGVAVDVALHQSGIADHPNADDGQKTDENRHKPQPVSSSAADEFLDRTAPHVAAPRLNTTMKLTMLRKQSPSQL